MVTQIAIASLVSAEAEAIERTLVENGIACSVSSGEEVGDGIRQGCLAGCIIDRGTLSFYHSGLKRAIDEQPPWSDFQFIVLIGEHTAASAAPTCIEELGNVTVMEPPWQSAALVTAARNMVRARNRQLELEKLLRDRREGGANLRAFASLEAMFENAPGYIAAMVGPHHRFVMANAAYRKLVGRDVHGRTVREALPEVEEQGYLKLLDDVYASGEPYTAREQRLVIVREGGEREELFVTFAYQPVKNGAGAVTGVVAQGFNATEQKRSREHVHMLQNELIHMSRASAMGTMASTLAHELNQPLAAVANYASAGVLLLANGGADAIAQATAAIKEAEKNAVRAGEVIRKTRDMIVKGSPSQSAVDLEAILEEALKVATWGAMPPETECSADYASGIRVMADRIQIQQVVLNIIRNGLEAMARSKRKLLSLRTGRCAEMATVAISDTGCGLGPEARSKLFTPFFSSKSEGLGVGLSISRTIVEAHGGSIEASDNPGGGTVIRFTLPLA